VSLVDIRREEHVCIITLQREEKLNALSGAMERELLDALGGEDVRGSHCVVITGAGKAFSAGPRQLRSELLAGSRSLGILRPVEEKRGRRIWLCSN